MVGPTWTWLGQGHGLSRTHIHTCSPICAYPAFNATPCLNVPFAVYAALRKFDRLQDHHGRVNHLNYCNGASTCAPEATRPHYSGKYSKNSPGYPDDPITAVGSSFLHRGPKIKAILEANPRLEIIYFPAGAPDLNPQEHGLEATRRTHQSNHSCKKLVN